MAVESPADDEGASSALSRHHRAHGRLLLLGAATASLVAVAAVGFFLEQGHQRDRAAAVVAAQNLAQLLDENLSASFDRIDLALRFLADEVERRRAAGGSQAGLDELLGRQLARVPDAQALRIVDAGGVVVRSRPHGAEQGSVADRGYFAQLREGAEAAISRPMAGRFIHGPVMVFARRVQGEDGRFAGAVVATMELRRLGEKVARPDVGPRGAIAILAEDLSTVIWRGQGEPEAPPQQRGVSPQLAALRAEGRTSANYDAVSPVDGVLRTISFRRLDHHPFFIVVGLAQDDYLVDWRRQAGLSVGLLLAFLVLLVLGTLTTLGSLRRQQLSLLELARVQRLESLAVLAGGMAHDFNNLLTGITGNVSIAREELPAGSLAEEALADAEAAAVRARDLTRQLLTFSRGGGPAMARLDLSRLVEASARRATQGALTELRLETAAGLEVEGDAGQLDQVVQHLVENAVQAMDGAGALEVRTERVEVAAGEGPDLRPGAWALLSVADRGPGILPAQRPRIFDPFFTTKAKAKGLGLAISHSIVLRHGGRIEARQTPGGGATLRAWLPALEPAGPAAAPVGPAAPAAAAGAGSVDGERLLVVDDEEVVRHLAVRLLGPLGYEVVEARDGREALARYGEARAAGRPFAAVIMDLTIPGGMGGLETLGHLRRLDPAVVAVVSSGYSDDPVIARWAEHGFKGLLAKPYVAAELRETLRRVLQGPGPAA